MGTLKIIYDVGYWDFVDVRLVKEMEHLSDFDQFFLGQDLCSLHGKLALYIYRK